MQELFPYQLDGITWLKKGRFRLLADQMGLGKSAQVVRAVDELELKKVLIVCPQIARLTWEREFLKWSSRVRTIQIMTKRAERPLLTSEVVLCSFDYATHNFLELRKHKWDLLVVDESHFLKSIDAKRTRAIMAKNGVIHSCARTWFLTGTPMPNHPGEVWPMLYTFGATNLLHQAFTYQFCEGYEFNGRRVITGAKRRNLPELKAMLDSVMLRRTREEVLNDLPPVVYSELPVEGEVEKLTPELQAEFERLENVLSGLKNASPTQQLEGLSILAASIATLRRYCAMMKVKPVCELVKEELQNASYEKIVIFGVHREALRSIQLNLAEFGVVGIDGSVSPLDRQRAIDGFQNNPGIRVFVGNIQAAGTNITLTAGSQVLFLEQSWVPGDNQQAIARCHRIGQKSTVFARFASLANTVDEKVTEILLRKTSDIAALLENKVG